MIEEIIEDEMTFSSIELPFSIKKTESYLYKILQNVVKEQNNEETNNKVSLIYYKDCTSKCSLVYPGTLLSIQP